MVSMKERLSAVMVVVMGSVLLAGPVSASEVSVQDNGCVRTAVSRSGGKIAYVTVMNICQGSTLMSVDAHVYNGKSPLDDRSTGRRNLAYGQFFRLPPTGNYSPLKAAPSGSLTCGELWAPAGAPTGRPWGLDCRTM